MLSAGRDRVLGDVEAWPLSDVTGCVLTALSRLSVPALL